MTWAEEASAMWDARGCDRVLGCDPQALLPSGWVTWDGITSLCFRGFLASKFRPSLEKWL